MTAMGTVPGRGQSPLPIPGVRRRSSTATAAQRSSMRRSFQIETDIAHITTNRPTTAYPSVSKSRLLSHSQKPPESASRVESTCRSSTVPIARATRIERLVMVML